MIAFRTGRTRAAGLAAIGAVGLFLGGCMTMRHGEVERPAASEFGLGPRASGGGAYLVTVEPEAPLRVRQMQSVKLVVRTADQAPVEGARIAINGGMPEHGHGLPTEPRVTRSLGAGLYQVDGLKFNMGGWWELRLQISSAAGTDSVTFNVDL